MSSIWQRVFRLWLLLGLASLGACAAPALQGFKQLPPDLPAVVELPAVPFFPQDADQCGPAALAMLARFAGVPVTPEMLRPQLYLPERQGSLQLEMLAAARRQGLLAWVLRPDVEALLRQVAAGQPVLVLQNRSLPMAPRWHYAVVIGYDWPAQTLRLHSGLNAGVEMPLATFERTWGRSGHWAMVALSPLQLPASGVDPQAWLRSAAALERNRPDAALQAYQAAVRAWPEKAAAWLGLGNVRYAMADLEGAGQAFEEATHWNPAWADAWHNLAQVRSAQKRWPEAMQASARAVSLGGPRAERYRELQQHLPATAPSASPF